MRQSKGKEEIVEVEGGQVIRSLGRKDRHGKVYTFKGPRDRRFRLSTNAAIQFYDVQDRLGYDRPCKAIDWLMNKAKIAIDALTDDHHNHDMLTTITNPSVAFNQRRDQKMGLIDSRNKCHENLVEELSPMDLTWNMEYNSGKDFAFVDREPLQTSCPTIIHAFHNESVFDEAFLGFDFQQDNRTEDEEVVKLVPKHC